MEEIEKILDQIKSESDFFTKAKLLQFLNKDKQIPIKDLSVSLNLQPSHICHILRLNRLAPIIVDGYYSKMISISHLFILSRIKDKEKALKIYEKILGDNFTVSQTEELVRETLYGLKSGGDYLSEAEKNSLAAGFVNNNKIKPKIIQTRIKSKLIIEIKGSLAETTPVLKDILQRLSPEKKTGQPGK